MSAFVLLLIALRRVALMALIRLLVAVVGFGLIGLLVLLVLPSVAALRPVGLALLVLLEVSLFFLILFLIRHVSLLRLVY
jgi:hypothetical protein